MKKKRSMSIQCGTNQKNNRIYRSNSLQFKVFIVYSKYLTIVTRWVSNGRPCESVESVPASLNHVQMFRVEELI